MSIVLLTKPDKERLYIAPGWFSAGGCLLILFVISSLLIPFLITYYIGNFWLEQILIFKVPIVQYGQFSYISLETSQNTIQWSSDGSLFQSQSGGVLVSVQTSDQNLDYQMNVTIDSTITIYQLEFGIGLEYQIENLYLKRLLTQNVLLSNHAAYRSVQLNGNLILSQQQFPLVSDSNDIQYSLQYHNDSLSPTLLLQSTTQPIYRTSGNPNLLSIYGRIYFPLQSVYMKPNNWEMFKYFWIQYVPFFLIIFAVLFWIYSQLVVYVYGFYRPIDKYRF